MFEHKKPLLHKVNVEKTNSQYTVLLQEQLGGDKELKFNIKF